MDVNTAIFSTGFVGTISGTTIFIYALKGVPAEHRVHIIRELRRFFRRGGDDKPRLPPSGGL